MHTKPVLVVGGAGYIGSHMVLTLQNAGYSPVVLDNLSKGHKQAVMNAELIVADMADKEILRQLFEKYSFHAVMHFASFIEVGESVKFPARYYQNNVAATIYLLEMMVKYGVRNFIFSSSAAVYGESTASLINESHVLAPVNPYGRSKWMVEEILKDLGQSGDIDYAILRYFNAAGADPDGGLMESHDPESHLIPLVLQTAAGKRTCITVYGEDYPTEDGTCVRDYVHVMDICHAHLLALTALYQGKKKNIICNLGTGKGHSVMQVIKAARKVTGVEITVEVGKKRPGDPAVLVADASLVMQELGWEPRYPGLESMILHAWKAMGNMQADVYVESATESV
jgi:UDP-glucose 4-epimerase